MPMETNPPRKRSLWEIIQAHPVYAILALVALVLSIVWTSFQIWNNIIKRPSSEKPANANTTVYKVGETVHFGEWDWRVLDVQDGKALLLSEDIIELRPYNDEWIDVTWETCTLREYLNGKFLKKFHAEDRARIALTPNYNPDTKGTFFGERFETPGGKPTEDYVFLLSAPEVLKYFPGLKLHKDSDGDEWWYEADERLVAIFNGCGSWWWLRSPGNNQNGAAYVDNDGYVSLYGSNVNYETGGVRPALWLNL